VSAEDRSRWDETWAERRGGDTPASWLVRHEGVLTGGVAVELAAGRGADAIWLARRGYQVLAVDGSLVALQQARRRASESGVRGVLFVQADLDEWRLPPSCADLLLVFRFLDRRLFPMIRRAVRPGGLVIYETRTVRWLEREPGASAEYLLQPRELLAWFADWELIHYEEEGVSAGIVTRRPARE
jgi:SAM-dependent methyltransferase